MAKAFVTGLVVGTMTTVAVAASLSVVLGLPERLKAVTSPQPSVAGLPAAPDVSPDEVELPDASVSTGDAPARAVAGSGPDLAASDAPVTGLAVDPAPTPDAAEAVSRPEAVAEAAVSAGVSPTAMGAPDQAALPAGPAVPETPDGSADAGTSAPVPVTGGSGAGPASPEIDMAQTGAPESAMGAPVTGVAPAEPASPEAAAPQAPDITAIANAIVNEPELAARAPEAPVMPSAILAAPPAVVPENPRRIEREVAPATALPVAEASPEAETTPPPRLEAEPEIEAPQAPAVMRLGDNDANGPSIGTRIAPLTERANDARVARLPSIGQTPEPQEPEIADASADPDAPPVVKFARPIAVDPDLPRMALVLIHDAVAPVGPTAVEQFPLPLTIAIDAQLPNAADLAAAYRAQGHEVLALTDIPGSALPKDVEVMLGAGLALVPEALGVLEGTGEGVQASRDISGQVTAIARDAGLGLILQPKGLNTAQTLAAKEGVPSATVFRDFDGEGQDGRVMRRFLDQAAFRARQEENGVIMLGRMRPDTISALVVWGLQDRASTVALVPVSMVLSTLD